MESRDTNPPSFSSVQPLVPAGRAESQKKKEGERGGGGKALARVKKDLGGGGGGRPKLVL